MHLYFRKVRKKEKKITHGGGFSLAQWDSSAAAHTSRLDAELLDAVGAARRRGDPRLPGVARPPRSSSPAARSGSPAAELLASHAEPLVVARHWVDPLAAG